MNTFILLAYTLVIAILTVNVAYFFVFSVAGLRFRKPGLNTQPLNHTPNTLVIIPAYKEDEVIIQSAKSFQQQVHHNGCYTVVVIADELKEETIVAIKQTGASVCRLPVFEKRNKAKAINYLLSTLTHNYDNCIVMDADNVVQPDFVANMNGYLQSGYKTVQARRVAKNQSNQLSVMDGYSEIINNHIFRKGQRVLGFSSSLIGSGMGFEFELFKEVMADMNVFSGFDKELELRLLERKIKIEYAEDIIVFDEKVANHQVFINQRRRWMYAQFYFLGKNFSNALRNVLLHGNFDYGNKVMQFMLLPRVIAIGACALITGLSLLISPAAFIYCCTLSALLATALILPVKEHTGLTGIIRAAAEMPRVFTNMVFAMLTSGRASKKFLHTPHNLK